MSKSMILFVITSLAAAALVLPPWIQAIGGPDAGVVNLRPGLVRIDKALRGTLTLGDGVALEVSAGGIRIVNENGLIIESTINSAFVTAVTGTLEYDSTNPVERVTESFNSMQLNSMTLSGQDVKFFGVVENSSHSKPLRLTFTRVRRGGPDSPSPVESSDGEFVQATAEVPGADAVILHLQSGWLVRAEHQGRARGMKRDATWLWPGGIVPDRRPEDTPPTDTIVPDFTHYSRVPLGAGPASAPRALDLRDRGRCDLHIWGKRAMMWVGVTGA